MLIKAIMPIKLNNERLPGKNTKLLGDKPLIQHQLEALKESRVFDSISVFCSSEDVVPFLIDGVDFVKRDEKLDLPTSNFNQIFSSFIDLVDADIYVYAHATAPFITVDTIKECVNAVLSGKYDSAFCAVKIQDYLWQDNKPINFDATNLPRSQDLKPIYRETSGIYVIPKETYLKTGRRIGNNPYIKEVSFKESIDINNPEDFDLAQAVLNLEL
ncbi:MAG: acylneuraminate cytidylyltransferase family protein [Clostridiales bacterium]|nr:acylneuraminate cytidylyltransferase family protein [Clostridiales bacterium]